MNNINQMGSQWRTLQPQSPSDIGFMNNGSGGGGGAFQRPARQITKNPQNMFQNFPPTQSQSGNGSGSGGMNYSNFGSYGNGPGSSNGGGLLSPGGLSSGGRMTGGNAFDFGANRTDQQQQSQQQQPNAFGRTNGMPGPIGSFSSSRPSGNGFEPRSNGFESRSNGFGSNGSSMSSFERSISGNMFDGGQGATSNGFSRQMSMPSNLCDEGGMSNGFGNGRQVNNGGDNYRMFSSSRRDDSGGSPPTFGGGNGSMSEMKIGTWDDGSSTTNARSNNTFPPVGNFEIGTFTTTASTSTNRNGNNSTSMGEFNNAPAVTGGNVFNQTSHTNLQGGGLGIRETGIIEKLLHSYGFIQCCDRQARLFFHFSQFDGNIEHLKIGDPVEFEMTYDRRTGKPIASMVSKIAPEVVMSEERVIGTVTTEIKVDSETGQETQGRISYENRGECFFLPFTMPDVEGNVTLASGDKVSFQMATMQRSGTLVARAIRLENPAKPVKYQGVVNSVKEQGKFGFIERSDVVREIFFHFTEVREGDNVDLGDDVEFTIQTRNGKEVACTITKLAQGTVVFEDVGVDHFKGQVLKPIDKAQKYATDVDALNGRIKYRAEDRSEVEVPFGEKDQMGDFTLKHGDWVKFVIATDRRDKLQRATKIELMDESFQVSDERREQGTIQSLKEGFGFMRCAERDGRMFFHFSEWLDVKRPQEVGDECEFTVAPDPNQPSRLLATRIKRLPVGTVKFEIVIQSDVTGRVEVEPSSSAWPRSPSKSTSSSLASSASSGKLSDSEESNATPGKILYELNGMSLEIPLQANDCDLRNFPRKGDQVTFDINQLKSTKETKAVNIRLVETKAAEPKIAAAESKMATGGEISGKEKPRLGYVAALKDGFGFIETLSHDKEIFFHFSNFDGKVEKLEVGTEVEYCVFNREKGGKISAEGVKVVNKGTISALPAKDDYLNGKVVRPLRSVNPDQDEYCGLIQTKTEEGVVISDYKFGIASLSNKKELLQVGDPVQFQVHLTENFAVNIQATREKLRAFVEAMKGQFGFLSHEVDEGKKLFFHTSEVEGGEILQQGDEVEFVVVTNKRTGKHSACCVRKLSSSKRPERLISKLKTMNLEDAARGGKKISVVRQPKGPDGSKGFKVPRKIVA